MTLNELRDHVIYLVTKSSPSDPGYEYLGAIDYMLDKLTVDDRGEYVMPQFDPNAVFEIIGGDE